jgi:hypothetical protein
MKIEYRKGTVELGVSPDTTVAELKKALQAKSACAPDTRQSEDAELQPRAASWQRCCLRRLCSARQRQLALRAGPTDRRCTAGSATTADLDGSARQQ